MKIIRDRPARTCAAGGGLVGRPGSPANLIGGQPCVVHSSGLCSSGPPLCSSGAAAAHRRPVRRPLPSRHRHSATFATDPDFVAQDAIAWLLLSRAGVLEGSGNGDNLAAATFVQRVNTVGGLAPSIGCNSPADIGKTAFVAYEADYVFYKNSTATPAVAERN